MERTVFSELCAWKCSPDRKPLILNGARQVGKTWILKHFGELEYENIAYINCDTTPSMHDAFTDFDTERLIRFFSAVADTNIRPGSTLIILDEIQEVPVGLTALKYFCENAPEYHIVAAGSLLGITVHSGTGFPVGKVDQIDMYPLSFREFLMALGKEQLLSQLSEHRWAELSVMSHTFIELLRQYYYVGGMPEVVRIYSEEQDLQKVRAVQRRILADYRRDFSKHVPGDVLPRVNLVWDNIPAQMAKENKKFIYGAIKKGARASEFEKAIQWLTDAGLVYKVHRVTKVAKPLRFYKDNDAFKLFVLDLGLLGAMVGASARDILANKNTFSEYKGAFTEQYVMQEMAAVGAEPYYFSRSDSTLEVDFVVQNEYVYPIEVKSEENLRSKSLRTLYDGNPELRAVRFSMADYREQDWMTNVPLYLAGEWLVTAE